MMKKPSRKEFEKFLKVFNELSEFEGVMRANRNMGLYKGETLPFPEVVAVLDWINEKMNSKELDLIDKLIREYENKSDELMKSCLEAQNQNDFITYSTLREEAEIYDKVAEELKAIGGLE